MIQQCDLPLHIEVMIKAILPQHLQETFGQAIRSLQSLTEDNHQQEKMITTEEACVTQAVKGKGNQLEVQTMRIIHPIIPPHQQEYHQQISSIQSKEVAMLEDQEKLVIRYFTEVVT